tara:strand:+ start:1862 stop:2287 length:426 start_codon:yes stop_codon:yes gene_type:complete
LSLKILGRIALIAAVAVACREDPPATGESSQIDGIEATLSAPARADSNSILVDYTLTRTGSVDAWALDQTAWLDVRYFDAEGVRLKKVGVQVVPVDLGTDFSSGQAPSVTRQLRLFPPAAARSLAIALGRSPLVTASVVIP